MSWPDFIFGFVAGYAMCWWTIKYLAKVGFTRSATLGNIVGSMKQDSLLRLRTVVEKELSKRREG